MPETPDAQTHTAGDGNARSTESVSPLPGRKPFSARYGIMSVDRARDHDDSRHIHSPQDGCEPDRQFRCRCPGGRFAERQCCCRITAEDMLCDACRGGCVRFVDGHLIPIMAAATPTGGAEDA